MNNRNLALIPLLTIALFGCSAERIVDRPVPVEIVRTEYVPVPMELTKAVPPADIPDTITYGQALTLWAQDRKALLNANEQLMAIRKLVDDQR